MTTYFEGDPTPIDRLEDLRDTLLPDRFVPGRTGIEWELLPVDDGGRLVSYHGPCGVGEMLDETAEGGAAAVREGGRTIALRTADDVFIGLEPGAQVEISTPPLTSLGDLESLLRTHASRLDGAAGRLGWRLRPWGLAPADGPERHPDVPKERYAILRRYLEPRGERGRWMMKLTASVQLSFDYPDEDGLGRQVAAALRLVPMLVRWTANAPVAKGVYGPDRTHRPSIWSRTDPLRSGLPAFFFRPHGLVDGWLRYALTRPALFFVRDGRWIEGDGRSFEETFAAPRDLGALQYDDWAMHQSTLFTELRIRGYLEVRTLDSLPLPVLMAAAGWLKGLLGDPGRIASWAAGLPEPTPEGFVQALAAATRNGAGFRWDAAEALFGAARLGLRAFGEDPDILEPVERLAREGTCPAAFWGLGDDGSWDGPGLFSTP